MGRTPCCEKMGTKKGPWTPEEDQILISYVQRYGHDNWRALPKQAGLLRCGKSCRLRWTNYLRPDIKRGNFTKEEEEIIVKLHQVLGNRWSAMATRLPGRTDNEIKNFWHTHLKKRPKLQNMGNHGAVRNSSEIPMPLSFSSQLRLQSSGYASTSIDNIPKKISTSDTTSMVPMTCPVIEENKNLFLGVVVDPRLQLTYLPGTKIQTMDCNSTNINDDRDFWYTLFVKAGGTYTT